MGRQAAEVLAFRATFLCVLLLCMPAAALDAPSVRVEAPSELRVGARLTVPIAVHVPTTADGANAAPVVVSAHAAGAALSVVKARLLRADAIDPSANPLRFELPLLAVAPGIAVLNVSVLTYQCTFRCQPMRYEFKQQVLVRDTE